MKDHKKTVHQQKYIDNKLEFYKGLSEEQRIIEALRIKSEIDSVNVNAAYNAVKDRLHKAKTYQIIMNRITRLAAILTIPLLLFTFWNIFNGSLSFNKNESSITWQKIESPLGIRSYIKLPDGTDLWLNAGSTIKYSIPFSNETRHLELTGEAYLNVAKNRDVPFIVSAQNTTVKVLGTQFNVKAYPYDNTVEVTLEEGKVEFHYTKNNGEQVFTPLEVNDRIVFNKNNSSVYRINEKIEKYFAWHKNILVFDDTPMPDVAQELEKWYGVKVQIDDEEILKYKFTTTFINEPLTRVLELLELSSPIRITYKPDSINNSTHRASQSVVTITKK